MIESLILIEGSVKEEHLTISLSNAKQLVIGRVPGSGWILHVAANSAADLGKALLEFGQVQGVTSVVTLTLQNS
jgi:hypothetical protein